MNSENNPLGDALHAAASQLPTGTANYLGEQITEAADAVHAVVDDSNAEEAHRAESHIQAAREKAAEALAELRLARQALGEYSVRLGFGGLPAEQSGSSSASQQLHAIVDPGIPASKKTDETSGTQPAKRPASPTLSAEEQAWFETDAEYTESRIEEVHDNGDGTYHVITDRSIGERVPAPDGIAPKIGEVVRQYLSPGRAVRGLVVGGRLQYYRSKSEEEVRSAMRNLDVHENIEADTDKTYRALPPIIRERLDFERMQYSNAGDNTVSQDYRISVSHANVAYEIAKKYRTPEAIDAFLSQPFKAQHTQEPNISMLNPNDVPTPEMTRHIFEYAKWYLTEAARRREQ